MLFIFSGEVLANKGLEIALKSDENFDGYGDSSSEMTMELISKKGDVVTRKLRFKRLEVPGDGDKSLAVFESPRDVRGVGILSYSHKVEPDDQWLYLPALKRVKRIASKNRSGPFLVANSLSKTFLFKKLKNMNMNTFEKKNLMGYYAMLLKGNLLILIPDIQNK